MGAELFLADERTSMMKTIVAFRYFVNSPKEILYTLHFLDTIQIICSVAMFVMFQKM